MQKDIFNTSEFIERIFHLILMIFYLQSIYLKFEFEEQIMDYINHFEKYLHIVVLRIFQSQR